MPDSFSELRTSGGSNKPWVAAGVFALALALIGVALAGAYWSSQPGATSTPATVTVTAQPSAGAPPAGEVAAGTYSGTFNNLREDARRPQKASWPVVATFGGGTATVTYPRSGCSALIDASLANVPLTAKCSSSTGSSTSADGSQVDAHWKIEVPEPGLVTLTYLEGDTALAGGTLSLGAPGQAPTSAPATESGRSAA